MDVKIYTFSDNRPDFIYWQTKMFRHFLEDNYEFIVINNGATADRIRKNAEACQELGLRIIEIPEKHHENPNVAAAYPIDWTLKNYIAPDRDVKVSMFLDSDMFLIRKFSIINLIDDNHLAALPQQRGHVRYIWSGLVMINHCTIHDLDQLSFHCSGCMGYCPLFNDHLWYGHKIEGQQVDVGGATYFYFRKHPNCKIKYLYSTHHINPRKKNLDALPKEILEVYDPEFAFEFIDQTFFHYGSGSNWKNQSEDFIQRKTQLSEQLFLGLISGTIKIPHRKLTRKYFDPGFRYSQYISSIKYWIHNKVR